MKKAIILIHEFWGVNAQMERVASRLRAEGFEVRLADLYGGKVAQSVEEARAMKDAVRDEEALEILKSEVRKLGDEGIGAEDVAIWGFCMGGSYSFLAAASGLKIGAYIVYYGSRISADENLISRINTPLLGVFGGQDKAIPQGQVLAFKAALEKRRLACEVYIYEDADHAFFNDERPSYNPTAAQDAWERTLAFLQKHL